MGFNVKRVCVVRVCTQQRCAILNRYIIIIRLKKIRKKDVEILSSFFLIVFFFSCSVIVDFFFLLFEISRLV